MHMSIKEIDATELAERMEKDDKLRILDVREMREIAAGTIPGADPMPMATIPVRIHDLSKDEDIVVICRSGARSAQVCMFMQQHGFDKVYNLRGGLMNWARSGLQIGMAQAS